MKLKHDDRMVQRSGVAGEGKFKISASAHMFDILSSKIYTDVPLAIVRELSTNASDAHIEVGNGDKPFDVHLPNHLEPWFEISDYGPGLSPADVENTYTVYGESTRNESDDFTGALGIGSKSPFAYTDQFTVVSRVDGRQWTYSLFKNEANEPSMALLGEQDTDKPNGLSLRIPVETHEVTLFQQAARKVYQWFKVRPNIKGADIQFDDDKPAFTGDGFAVYDKRDESTYSPSTPRLRVVMGQVCYDASNVVKYDQYSDKEQFGNAARVVLHVEIGDVTIAASRESLQGDERTVDAIKARLKAAYDEVKRQCEAKLKTHTIKLERIRAMDQFHAIIGFARDEKQLSLVEKGKYRVRSIQVFRNRMSINTPPALRPSSQGNYVFIREDEELKPKHKRRIKHWMSERDERADVFLAAIDDDAAFAETFGATTVDLSTLPPAPVNRTGNGPSVRRYIKRLSGSSCFRIMDNWRNVEEADLPTDDSVTLYSVARRNATVIHETGTMDHHELRQVAAFLGIDPENVYGISANVHDKFKNRLGMVDIMAEAKAKVEQVIAGLNEYDLAMLHGEDTNGLESKLIRAIDGMSSECDDIIKFAKVDCSQHNVLRSMARRFGVTIPDAPRKIARPFWKKYPLLRALLNAYNPRVSTEQVVEYMQLVENAQ